MKLFNCISFEGGLPFGPTSDPEAHDAWFRERVKEALNSEEVLPHNQVMNDVQALINRKKRLHKLE